MNIYKIIALALRVSQN